jgi:hypothetical protein
MIRGAVVVAVSRYLLISEMFSLATMQAELQMWLPEL